MPNGFCIQTSLPHMTTCSYGMKILEYIKIVKKHGLEISQPGLDPSRGITWQITKRRSDVEAHLETKERPGWCSDPHLPPCAAFVEIMAPVFSRDAWHCVWHMIQNDLVHGWGLDLALQKCVETLLDCENALLSLSKDAGTNAKTARISAADLEGINKLHVEFKNRMSDDLHTPTILNSSLQEALRYMNSSVNMLKKKQSKQQQLSAIKSLVDLEEKVKEVLDVLGLLSNLSYTEVLRQLKVKALKRALLTEEDVMHSIEERMVARKNKEFSKSYQYICANKLLFMYWLELPEALILIIVVAPSLFADTIRGHWVGFIVLCD